MKVTRTLRGLTRMVEWAPYRANDLHDRARAVSYITLWKDNTIAKMRWNYPDMHFKEYEWSDVPNLENGTNPSIIAIKVLFGDKEGE